MACSVLTGVGSTAKLVGLVVIPVAAVAFVAAGVFAFLFFRGKRRAEAGVRAAPVLAHAPPALTRARWNCCSAVPWHVCFLLHHRVDVRCDSRAHCALPLRCALLCLWHVLPCRVAHLS